MSTLLVIMSYEGAKEQVFRQWEHYKTPGWPILGVCPENSFHSWPADINHCELVGKSSGYSTPDTVKYWVGTWERLLLPRYEKYNDFILVEYDTLILRDPEQFCPDLVTHLAGGPMSGFKATRFYHCPWWARRKTAEIIVEEGKKMIAEGEFEHGSPDVFLGLLLDRRPDIKAWETNSFSVNGGDLTNRKAEAIKAIEAGAWLVHGLRTQEEMDWILQHAHTPQTA